MTMPDAGAVEAVVQGRHGDPFAVLGPHDTADGCSVPAFLPGASGGAVIGFAFYFLLAFVYPAGMGFGDVKLAGVLGAVLAWYGWAELVVGGFLGFLLGGVVGILVILSRRGTRKSMLPFGPFMLAGTAAAMVLLPA